MVGFKILACGDIHIELELLKTVLIAAKKVQADLILFSGDFCDGDRLSSKATLKEFLEQAIPVVNLLKKLEIPLFYVLGNHDPVELASLFGKNPLITDSPSPSLILLSRSRFPAKYRFRI